MSKMIFSLCLMLCAAGFIHMNVVHLGYIKREILNQHNELRKGKGAADMMKMIWTDKLAHEAGSWIKSCIFEQKNETRGENAIFSTSPDVHDIIKGAVYTWFAEKTDFNKSANNCYMSCHYSQVVWSNTTEIGCAARKCRRLSAFGTNIKNALYMACFYNPRGNIGNNIYTRGAPCSECPNGTSCDNGLCVGGPGGGSCTDFYNVCRCRRWVRRGQCDKYPSWMLVNCKKSCKVC